MIPPVSERQNRPCKECVFYHNNDGWNMSCSFGDIDKRLDCYRDKRKKIPPCNNNFTEQEMSEIIKQDLYDKIK